MSATLLAAPALPTAAIAIVPLWSLEPAAEAEFASPVIAQTPEPASLPSEALTMVWSPGLEASNAVMVARDGPDATGVATGLPTGWPTGLPTGWLDQASGEQGPTEGGAVAIDAGALTTLSDGGLGLAPTRPGGIGPSTATDKFHAGMVESGEAEFQLYSIDMRVTPMPEAPFRLSLATGVRAIRADLSRELGGTGTPGFTPVPVVGTDVRWDVSPRAYFSGTALTQMIDASGDVLDLKAEAGISFSRKIDFAVGYQYLRSTIDAGPRNATLEQEGPFARLRISF